MLPCCPNQTPFSGFGIVLAGFAIVHESDILDSNHGLVSLLSLAIKRIAFEALPDSTNTFIPESVLKEIMSRRADLRIILMSATIQTDELLQYWSGLENPNIAQDNTYGNILQSSRPVEINIPGRTFPVQEFFLEDVLNMTGFVADGSSRYGSGSGQLDLDLLHSLVQKNERMPKGC